MSHNEVLKMFKNVFPTYSENMSIWFPNGKDSIRVRMYNGTTYIFTFRGGHDWRFETERSFVNSIRKGAK